uniref:TNFR-Cys domain-containing protein n=2 Tax=Macrostomum lignano TaxID=282301 RepID=A0A1I8I8D5_9PLAT
MRLKDKRSFLLLVLLVSSASPLPANPIKQHRCKPGKYFDEDLAGCLPCPRLLENPESYLKSFASVHPECPYAPPPTPVETTMTSTVRVSKTSQVPPTTPAGGSSFPTVGASTKTEASTTQPPASSPVDTTVRNGGVVERHLLIASVVVILAFFLAIVCYICRRYLRACLKRLSRRLKCENAPPISWTENRVKA